MPVADSTPQASIAHPFASSSPSVRVNGAMGSLVARRPVSPPCGDEGRALEDAYDQQLPKHTTSTSTRVSSGDRSQSSLRPWLRCVARFHGAPHASATCSRSLQGVFSPAVVALEQPTSDAPVTHLSWSLACAKNPPRRLLDGTSRSPFQENGPRPRFPVTLPKEEPRPLSPLPREKETTSATRGAFHRSRTSDRDTLADALAGRRRSHGFATVIRPPMPFRPARSPALG
jgi:hypothetical protein